MVDKKKEVLIYSFFFFCVCRFTRLYIFVVSEKVLLPQECKTPHFKDKIIALSTGALSYLFKFKFAM